jgi:hypothetical protein
MNLGRAMHQKTAQVELPLEARGEAPRGQRSGEAWTARKGSAGSGTAALMERVVDSNLNIPNRRMPNGTSGGVAGE